MTKVTTTTVRTCSASKKEKDSAVDDLQKQVAPEKKKRELKKKQQASKKRAEEEKKKKTDQEKADENAGMVTVSPPNNNEEIVTIGLDDEEEMEINFEYSQAAEEVWIDTEDVEALARHGISPNHLFGKDHEESTGTTPTEQDHAKGAKNNESTTVDLTAAENSPDKKESKRVEEPSGMKASNCYTTSSFSVAKIAHKYTHPRTFVEAAITLIKEDKPKELIAAIKYLLTNGQILDPNFARAPLKHNKATTKPKLITTIDDVPVNFTHLGKYAFTSGNRIFEKKKDWKGENDRHSKPKKADHRDNTPTPETFKDPVVYFTVAIATDIPPRTLINGIRMEWEANGGGKLQVKDLQSQESKVVMALYLDPL